MAVKTCPTCNGDTNCRNCTGSGKKYKGFTQVDCPKCKGSGNCTRCHGKGVVPAN